MSLNKTFKLSALSMAVLSIASSVATPTFAADEEQIEKIMVTGSRIARAEIASTSPITVVTKAQLTNLGITDVSSALRRLPAITGNSRNNQSSSGAFNIQTATLRGIEATNTLVLLNGRRMVGSDEDGLVDLSSVPFEAISRMEVLKDGASAIYGSDAIAGVINIITHNGYEGFEVNARYGQSSKSDAQEREVGLRMGFSTDKGNVLIAASTKNNAGWLEKDRYMTKDIDQTYLGFVNRGSSTAPNAKLSGFGLEAGNWTVLDANDPLGSLVPYVYDDMSYNYRAVQSGANDNKSNTVFISADYELSDDVLFFSEFSLYDGFVRGNQAPPGVDTGYYAGSADAPNAFLQYDDAEGNHFGVGANQKYNPFGIAGNAARRFSEYGPRIYETESTVLRYTAGLRGTIFEEFDWELNYSSQSSDMTLTAGSQPSINMIERALSNECETELDPNCVALNVFGPEGSITTEMLDFINVTQPTTTNSNSLMFMQAHISGPIMALPAGDLMFSTGLEYREDQLSMGADQAQATETFDVSWGGTTTPVESPVREITEMYLELSVPVLENLHFEAAGRYSDYSDIDESTFNPKFGLSYQPLDILKLRATYSTGFRAPTMAEMYQGKTITLGEVYDPCNLENKGNFIADTPACNALGLDITNMVNGIQNITVVAGGNPDLSPEEAKNMTVGMALEPMENLSLTVDYFNIEQTDVVFASDRYVINQHHAGNPEYANDVKRAGNGTGYLLEVYSPANNVAARNIAGIDVNVNYLLSTDIGEWRFNLDTTFATKFEVQDVNGNPFRDLTGTYDDVFGSIPEVKSSFQMDWSMNNVRATWDFSYNSKIEASETDAMDATVFHNMQIGYFIESIETDVNFGIQNVFDKKAPFLKATLTSTDDSLYSHRGRFMYVGIKKSF
jgi:iron complex outermembrane receptor protein